MCSYQAQTVAASLLSLSPSPSINFRSRACLHIQQERLLKNIVPFSLHLEAQKCKIKLYVMHGGSFSCHRIVRSFATTAGSLEVDGTRQGNQVSSSVLSPHDSPRSEKLSNTHWEDMSELERQLQELFDEVKSTIRSGRKNDAIELLQANYETVKAHIDEGARGMEEAAILDVIALGYMAIGDFKIVESLLDMLSEVVNGLKDNERFLDSVLTHMGSMYSTLGKFEKSTLSYDRALKILERDYGKDSNLLITPLLGLAKVLGLIGRVTEATDVYHRVISIVEYAYGEESEELVLPLFALGNILLKERRAADAEIPFNRILDIYTKLYGKSDGKVGMALCSLAHAKRAKGNVDEAIDLYKNALVIIKESNCMALDDDVMEKIRIDLAELLHVVGRGDEGRVLLTECLLITEKYKGKDHPSSVRHLMNLATSYSRSEKFAEAEQLLRTCLRILTKNVPLDDQSVTFPMLELAITLYNLRRDEEAEQLALEALRIREKAFGKESLPVGEALDCLVSIQTRLGKDESELLKLLKRVLRIQEKAFGTESEEIIITLNKILFCLDKLGMKNQKFPVQRRLSVLRNKYQQMVKY